MGYFVELKSLLKYFSFIGIAICIFPTSPCLAKEQKAASPKAIPFEVKGCINLLKERDFKAAIDMCKQATSKYPKNKYAWYGLGKAYSEMGEMKLAVSAFKRELALVPKEERIRVYSELSVTYMKMADVNNVIVCTNKILASEASSTDKWMYSKSSLFYLASMYSNQEKYKESLYYWDTAIGLMDKLTGDEYFYLNAAHTAKLAGDYPRALSYLLELPGPMKQRDNGIEIKLACQKADIYRLLKNYNKAEEKLNDALKIIQDCRGKELYNLADMRRFLDIEEATTYVFWGRLHYDKQDSNKAREYMRRAYDLVSPYKDLDSIGRQQAEYIQKEITLLETDDDRRRPR